MTYEPKYLRRWSHPRYYAGEIWPDYYSAGVGQSRDSDCLERSNFRVMLVALGGESESVVVVRESHFLVGWIEWIAIHQDDDGALQVADEQVARLEDYPVLDEGDFSELEWSEAATYWDERCSPRERVQMAIWERDRYHWLAGAPCWIYGRMSYYALANYGSQISEALCEMLRR